MTAPGTPEAREQFRAWKEDFERVSASLAQTSDSEARKVALRDFIQRGEATIGAIGSRAHPWDNAELRLATAAAQIELARYESGYLKEGLIAAALRHCDAGCRAALQSGSSAEAAEDLAWALGLMTIAREVADESQRPVIEAQSAGFARDLGETLERLDRDQLECCEALFTGQILYAQASEARREEDRWAILGQAQEVVWRARRLAASCGNTSVATQATATLAEIDRALAAPAGTETTPAPAQTCANCGAARVPGARFCTDCGTSFPG
jgi:hypothetical protein